MAPLTIAAIEDRLRELATADEPAPKRAAVAIVLRERRGEVEALLIRRSERPGDPWSGHVALPGGRFAPADGSIEATAVRETREEIGLDLASPAARRIGRLPDHRPMKRVFGLAITPVVFALEGDPALALDPREVAGVRWVSLAALASGASDGRFLWWWRPIRWLPVPVPFVVRCWRVGDFVVWGLTHRILSALLALPAPAASPPGIGGGGEAEGRPGGEIKRAEPA